MSAFVPALLDAPAGVFPQRFGGYELLERIGQGGMGIVYRARQLSLDRIVAIKVLPHGALTTKEQVLRFRTEAAAAGSLQHPHIVAIHEVGLCEDRHYLVMDFVEGQTLAQVISDSRFELSNFRRTARYVQTMAKAAHYAHEHGILHRDLKPSNVLIDANDQPRITDFGLAKRLESGTDLTLSGQVLGSPQYMAPEQAMGRQREVGRRSDVYALGAILYHLLTGRAPFVGEALSDILPQVINDVPLRPRLLNPTVPADLETLCLKCLEKEGQRRYPTALALAEELDRFLRGEPIVARPVGVAGKVWRWSRRKPQAASLAAVAVLLLVLGLSGVVWQWRRAEAERLLAQRQAYVSDIYAAQQALKADNPGRALELLDRCRPAGDAAQGALHSAGDLRGFEWRYLSRGCQNDAQEIGSVSSGVVALEVSRDGDWLLAASGRGAVKLWSLKTFAEVSVVPDQSLRSYATFSPDSSSVLFTDQRVAPGCIIVWDIQRRERRAPIIDHRFVGPMAFSPDGRWLGYGVLDPPPQRALVIRDFLGQTNVGEFRPLTPVLDNHHGYAFVFGRDSQSVFFTESGPPRLARVNLLDGSEPRYYSTGQSNAITAMALNPDGKILATATGFTETGIKLWEVPSMRALSELSGHGRWVAGLCFSPDGRTLASASADQRVRLWDIATGNPNWISRPLFQPVWRVCWARDGQALFCGWQDGQVYRWPLPPPPAEPPFGLYPAKLPFLIVAPSGEQFAGIRSGRVFLGDTRSSALPTQIQEWGTNNTCVEFSSDERLLYVGTEAGEVREWSIADRKLQRAQRRSEEPVWALRRDGIGRILAVVQTKTAEEIRVGHPCRIGIWRSTDWQEQPPLSATGLMPACAVSPDGRWLALGHGYGPVQVWDLRRPRGTPPASFPAERTTTSVAFSPDNHLLAASSEEGFVQVWELPTLRPLPKFRAHWGGIQALVFSPDGRRLATAGADEEAIKLWDVTTWRELIELGAPGESLKRLTFSTQGDQLAAVNSGGDILLWSAPATAGIAPRGNQPADSR